MLKICTMSHLFDLYLKRVLPMFIGQGCPAGNDHFTVGNSSEIELPMGKSMESHLYIKSWKIIF